MEINTPYTVLGSVENPLIQFYHEIVPPRHNKSHPESFTKTHIQPYYEISFFISGKRDLKVRDTIFHFNAGDIFIVSPTEEHCGSLTHGMLDRYRLHIWPTALNFLPGKETLLSVFANLGHQNNKISLTEKQLKIVDHYLSNIDFNIKLGNPKTKNISALADIIKLLVFLNDITAQNENTNLVKNRLLLNILSFIDSCFDTVTTAEIESQFSLSHATLWRLFIKELNMSPSAYILDTKLKKAKILLQRNIDIQTISDLCGFCDCSYFIKKFKEKYGKTPRNFKINKEN